MLEECLVRIVAAVVRVLVATAGGNSTRESGLATASSWHRWSPDVAHFTAKTPTRWLKLVRFIIYEITKQTKHMALKMNLGWQFLTVQIWVKNTC